MSRASPILSALTSEPTSTELVRLAAAGLAESHTTDDATMWGRPTPDP